MNTQNRKENYLEFYGCKNNVITIQFPLLKSILIFFLQCTPTRQFQCRHHQFEDEVDGHRHCLYIGDKIELFSLSFNDTCLKWINIFLLLVWFCQYNFPSTSSRLSCVGNIFLLIVKSNWPLRVRSKNVSWISIPFFFSLMNNFFKIIKRVGNYLKLIIFLN